MLEGESFDFYMFDFSFISWEASCLLEYLLTIQETSDETFLLFYPAFTVWSPSLY